MVPCPTSSLTCRYLTRPLDASAHCICRAGCGKAAVEPCQLALHPPLLFATTHLYAPPQDVVLSCQCRTGPIGCSPTLWDRGMHDAVCRVPKILLLRG